MIYVDGASSGSSTPAAGSVTLAMQAPLAANSIVGNNTGSPATPIALPPAQINALLGAAVAITGGTIQGVVTKQTIVPYAVASRTLVAADRDAMATDTYATTVLVTLPQDSACTDIQIGHHGDEFNLGVGTVTFAAGTGVTMYPTGGIACPTGTGASWEKIAANTYAVVGRSA